MLVHVVHYGEFYLVVVFGFGRDLGRTFLEVESVSLVIYDSGPVFLNEHAFAHYSVSVSCARFQAAYRDFVKGSDRFSSETSHVEVLGPFHVIEVCPVVRCYFYPAYCE